MKICDYCGLENDDSASRCASCGAVAFLNKCNHCGTTFSSSYCPNCGVKAGALPSVCPDCGASYFSAACPRCGYSPARAVAGRSRVQPVIVQQAQSPAASKKRVTFGTVLLWFLFFPIMAIIAIWRAPKLRLAWKILLTMLLAGFFLYTYYYKT